MWFENAYITYLKGPGLPKQRGFTLIEVLIVVLILGILVTLMVPAFQNAIEKVSSAEVYLIFGQVRQGYLLLRAKGLPRNFISSEWDPNVWLSPESTESWHRAGTEDPNKNSDRFFVIDVWGWDYCIAHAPVFADRNVVIAFRKGPDTPANSYDGVSFPTPYIYMDLDTSELLKSSPY